MAAQPVLFTVEFRRKMAELSQAERLTWLTSVAGQVRRAGASAGGVLAKELREVARGCRLPLVESISKHLGPFDRAHVAALLEVPRERFVRPADLERSAEDGPLPLDDLGLATISAPHAYLLSFRLLELGAGDALVELGTGSGYGAALASFIVGERGRVLTFEIDHELVTWAGRTLEEWRNVAVVEGDAMTSTLHWAGAKKVAVMFAVEALPSAWLDAIPDGGRLVAPVGSPGSDQRLVLAVRRRGRIVETDHGAVRYVSNRSTR